MSQERKCFQSLRQPQMNHKIQMLKTAASPGDQKATKTCLIRFSEFHELGIIRRGTSTSLGGAEQGRKITNKMAIALHWPEDRLMFHRVVSPLVYHCLLSVSYFIWYFFQRRYTAKHFAENDTIRTHRNSIASSLGAFDPPRISGPRDEVPLSHFSPRQALSLPIDDVVGGSEPRGPIRQRDFDFRHK
ncbi:hypothetical protein BGZ57DRAFT_847725 [Hyaloscypha finlandica]|nr:hypothetical protein BGZ57DRAFT_847725 [Hyaloscypha finlandica]